MRTLAIAATAALIASATTAGAFLTIDWEIIQTRQFKVAAYGADLRVYEWESPSDPDRICAASFSQKGPVGMQCWGSSGPVIPNSN